MINNKIIISFFITVLLATACKQNTKSIKTDLLENKIDSVLSLMTLKEKNWSDDSNKFNCNCKGTK
jgi:hypothetical protein